MDDAVVWSVLVVMIWNAALTFLCPLTLILTFSKEARRKFFAWYFVKVIGPHLKVVSAPLRQRLFRFLGDSKSTDNPTDEGQPPLEILEIGVGDGANLTYYPPNINLTALYVNDHFKGYFEKNVKGCENVTLKRTVTESPDHMDQIGDESVDVVVSTYVQCSCRDPDAVMREVWRVLKPGGKYLFLEHVCFPKNDVYGRTLQNLIMPLWYVYSGNCVLNKDIAAYIKRSGFSNIICEDVEMQSSIFYLVKPQIIGMATK